MTTLHDAPTPGAEAAAATDAPRRRTRRWIDDWQPEDPTFWEGGGRQVARRNLVWSIFAEHIGFSVWFLWSMSTGLLAAVGFGYGAEQLFILTSVSSGVGALLRVPYTFAVPVFGGRNWTVISALLLLIPTIMFVVAVQNPDTPYSVMILISALSGFGGGTFVDDPQQSVDQDFRAFGRRDGFQGAGDRRVDLDRDLVRLQFDQGLVDGNGVAGGLEPLGDGRFGHRFA